MELLNKNYDPAVSVGTLNLHPENPREGDQGLITQSIETLGFYGALIVQVSTRFILAGNHRYRSAIENGAASLPVIWVDVNDEVALRILLADNKASDSASNNEAALSELLKGLMLETGTLEGTCFSPEDLDQLLADIDSAGLGNTPKADVEEILAEAFADAGPPPPEAPELQEVLITAPGEIWILGEHRVSCGDATALVDVDRLLAGEAVDLVFTDPPYNVDYEGYTEDRLTIKGDKMTAVEFKRFLLSIFTSYRRIMKTSASLYVCHSSSWQREFQGAMESAGFEVRCQIIWAKNTFAWGFGRYKFQHEPIFYGHVTKQKDSWYGDKTQSTLWAEKKPSANRIHPTAKPVELVERALVNSSVVGDIVADLFGGSGSTLIGCERRGRKSRLMEIDPKYVDCIVRRWQELTGKAAVLDGDGRTFDEVTIERRPAALPPAKAA
jgi:DNA modification methylase